MGSVVSVLSKNTNDNTVTVSLNQFWPTGSIDSIYYQWNPDYYNEKCIEESDVANGENFAEITIQCNFLKHYAKATVCLEESLQEGFSASLPKTTSRCQLQELMGSAASEVGTGISTSILHTIHFFYQPWFPP